ncbi:hypothetical protein LXL04_037261 [Taraxacum kok-saghyz]
MDSDRRKVRRRRPRPPEIQTEVITTYFVTNVPKEATKGEIQKLFGKFGRLTDVFMGLKIGKNGKHFVFIRFAGVKDEVELERELNGTILRGKKLEINISIHDRKENPRAHTFGNRRMPPTTSRAPPTTTRMPTTGGATRDHRSYGDTGTDKIKYGT